MTTMKILLAGVAALLIATAAHADRRYPEKIEGWSLDWRRCIAKGSGHIGNYFEDEVWFSSAGRKITFVRIDGKDFSMRPSTNGSTFITTSITQS